MCRIRIDWPRHRTAIGKFVDVRSVACLAAATVCFACAGCDSPPTFEFDALDSVPDQEKLTELSLGKYTVPIPVLENQAGKRPIQQNRFQFDFQLFALVSEQEKSQVEEAWKRHEGKIRDRVIQICRNASVEELQEPELATLKAQLIDALGPQLGNDDVQQLLITEVVSQQI